MSPIARLEASHDVRRDLFTIAQLCTLSSSKSPIKIKDARKEQFINIRCG